MPLSRPRLGLLCPHLLLLLLAGLTGCGPTSPDNAPGVESSASMSKPSPPKQGPAPGINPLAPVNPAANPGSLASANRTGAVNGLAMPARMTKALTSPNVGLETWAQSAPPAAVDPVLQGPHDKDERQAGAGALLEEQEYQDLDLAEEQANQELDEGQANQDPEEKGEK